MTTAFQGAKRLTLEDIKRANRRAGLFFFQPETVRFFRSRVSEKVYQGPGGTFLVTSEVVPSAGRRYSVRSFDPATGRVEAHGQPFRFRDRRDAHAAAQAAAQTVPVEPYVEAPL